MSTLKDLYYEIISFLCSCGGTYAQLHNSTCFNVIQALLDKRVSMTRDAAGKLSRVMIFWRIKPEDLAIVQAGRTPDDVNSGSIIYIAEHAGTDGRKGFIAAIRQLRQAETGIHGACWHSRWNQPETFRYYPRQETTL